MLKGATDCEYSMTYNEENIFLNMNSLNKNLSEIIPKFFEMVFNIKNLAKSNNNTQQLHRKEIKQLLLTTAYGYEGLGMPRNGFDSNRSLITPYLIQNFILNHFSPGKIIIISNKPESLDIIKKTLGELHPVKESEFERKPSIYYGGEYRHFNEDNELTLMIAFPTVSMCVNQSIIYSLLDCLYGPRGQFNPYDEDFQRYKSG